MQELSKTSFVFHHIGIAVMDLEAAVQTYRRGLGYQLAGGPYVDPVQKARVCFLSTPGSPLLELVAPAGDGSRIENLVRRGSGAYHTAYEVTDVHTALDELRAIGWITVQKPVPAVAFGGRLICWLYAPTQHLVELIQAGSAERRGSA